MKADTYKLKGQLGAASIVLESICANLSTIDSFQEEATRGIERKAPETCREEIELLAHAKDELKGVCFKVHNIIGEIDEVLNHG